MKPKPPTKADWEERFENEFIAYTLNPKMNRNIFVEYIKDFISQELARAKEEGREEFKKQIKDWMAGHWKVTSGYADIPHEDVVVYNELLKFLDT